MEMNKNRIKTILHALYRFSYNFVFVCYFAMFFVALGLFGWFILYLISGVTGTMLYYVVLMVLVCFSIVLIRIGIIEVFKKYIKK